MKGEATLPRTSVIVCTSRPGPDVVPTLEALFAQQSRGGEPEIVLVVHAPTEPFSQFLERRGGRANVKVLSDPGIGLSRARNLGFRACTGEIVAFLDDTATPEPAWLEVLEATFDKVGCDALGGEVVPVWDRPLPRWFDPLLEISIGARRSMNRGFLSFPETPFGANMAFRRETLARHGPFEERLGRAPGSMMSNEEVALCYRIYAAGGRIFFEPAVCVHHRVPGYRVSKRYAWLRAYWQGVSRVRMYRALGWTPPPVPESFVAFVKHAAAAVRHAGNPRLRMRAEVIALTRVGELVEDFRLEGGKPNFAFPRWVLDGSTTTCARPWECTSAASRHREP